MAREKQIFADTGFYVPKGSHPVRPGTGVPKIPKAEVEKFIRIGGGTVHKDGKPGHTPETVYQVGGEPKKELPVYFPEVVIQAVLTQSRKCFTAKLRVAPRK